MEDVKKLYPRVDTVSACSQVITPEKLEELTDNKLSKSRADEIKAKVNELKKDLNRYKKLRSKWKTANKVLHGIGVGVGIITGVAAATVAIISTEGIAIPAAIPITLATICTVETAISESIVFGLINRKHHKVTEKLNTVSLYMNRMYLFYQRAIDDRKITIEELEEFHKLVNEFESELSKLQTNGDHSFTKLEHLAETKARKEYEKELLDKLTEQKKNNLKSQFHLN